MRKVYQQHHKSSQLKKLVRRLDNLVQTGRFQKLSGQQQRHLLKRFRKLNRQLRPDMSRLQLRPALLAFLASAGVMGMNQSAQAQVPAFDTLQTNPFSLVRVGYESKPTYGDIDDDGDLDLFVGNGGGEINFFRNIGTATAPMFDTLQLDPFGLVSQTGASYVSLHLQDMDADGDYDLWYGDDGFQFVYFKNIGTVTAPAFDTATVNPFGLIAPYGEYEAKITTGDLDNDGDYDMLVGASYADVYYYENTGTDSFPAFAAAVQNPFGLANVGGNYAAPTIFDLDNDGDLDVTVNNNYGVLAFFENTGTLAVPAFATPVNNPFGIVTSYYYSVAVFADLDGDGDEDITQGEGYGGFFYQEDTSGGGASNVPPMVNIIANDTVCDNDTLDLAFMANDPNNDPITVTAVSTNQAVIPDANITINGTAPNYDLVAIPVMAGNADIIVTVMDSVSSVSDTLAVNVESCIPNTIPVVVAPANDSVCETDTLTLPFMASDGDGDPLIIDAYSDNQAVVPDANISVTGTAPNYTIQIIPAGQGFANISIEADDGEDVDSTGFEVEVVDCSVGLDASFFTKRFDVYPNPANDRIHYALDLFVPVEKLQIEVLDLAGRSLLDETLRNPATDLQGVLDISELSSGIYFLKVSSDLYSFNKKIVVE